MNKLGLLGAAALAGLLLSGGAHAATIVTNGSFEDGTFDGAANPDGAGDNTDNLAAGSTDITGWTTGDSDVAWIGTPNPFSLTPSDGDKFLDLTGYTGGSPFGSISQTIATVAGQAYALSFDLGSSSNYGIPAAILASAGLASLTFTSTLGGTDNWEHEVLAFVATGASTTISFAGASGANYIGLDNVSVAATPLPAPVLMFLTALVPLGFVGYRRMKQNNA